MRYRNIFIVITLPTTQLLIVALHADKKPGPPKDFGSPESPWRAAGGLSRITDTGRPCLNQKALICENYGIGAAG